MALANHHDNMDLWNSTHQPWNSVRLGPRKDLVGGWSRATLKWTASVCIRTARSTRLTRCHRSRAQTRLIATRSDSCPKTVAMR
jgi:alpha-L-fucosidase